MKDCYVPDEPSGFSMVGNIVHKRKRENGGAPYVKVCMKENKSDAHFNPDNYIRRKIVRVFQMLV